MWRPVVIEREEWDDGNIITWVESPFPFERKPYVPSRLIRDAYEDTVDLRDIVGTQSRVTVEGVEKHLDGDGDLPLLYRAVDGTPYIADGHHRLAAALLRGDRTARVLVVDVPG